MYPSNFLSWWTKPISLEKMFLFDFLLIMMMMMMARISSSLVLEFFHVFSVCYIFLSLSLCNKQFFPLYYSMLFAYMWYLSFMFSVIRFILSAFLIVSKEKIILWRRVKYTLFIYEEDFSHPKYFICLFYFTTSLRYALST